MKDGEICYNPPPERQWTERAHANGLKLVGEREVMRSLAKTAASWGSGPACNSFEQSM